MNAAMRGGFVAFSVSLLCAGSAGAERIKNPIALFSGLDKITGITTNFEVNVGQEGKFGGLYVKPYVCFTRPITEQPKTVSFVQVDLEGVSGARTQIFSGWMFAESPGLNAVEHPIFDVWMTGCKDPNAPPPPVEVPPRPTEGDIPEEDTGEETEEDAPAKPKGEDVQD